MFPERSIHALSAPYSRANFNLYAFVKLDAKAENRSQIFLQTINNALPRAESCDPFFDRAPANILASCFRPHA